MAARVFAIAVSALQPGIALGRILHPFKKRTHQFLGQDHRLQTSNGIGRGCGDMIALML